MTQATARQIQRSRSVTLEAGHGACLGWRSGLLICAAQGTDAIFRTVSAWPWRRFACDLCSDVSTGACWTGYIGITEKKMEATTRYWGYIGIVEKKMVTTIIYWDYIGIPKSYACHSLLAIHSGPVYLGSHWICGYSTTRSA